MAETLQKVIQSVLVYILIVTVLRGIVKNPRYGQYFQFFSGVILILIGVMGGGSIAGGLVRDGAFTMSIAVPAVALLLYMAMISAVAYTLWGVLLKYNPVSRVSVFGFMNPVFGVLLSALILGESAQALSIYALAALVLVSLGIYVVNKPERQA